MYENGSIIWCGGVEFMGVISLGDGWWMAYAADDPQQVVRIVREDVQT